MNSIVTMSKGSTEQHSLPTILYAPSFINKFARFFRNTANQEATKLNFYI